MTENNYHDVTEETKLINITVLDRNDNQIYVADESRDMTILRHKIDFEEDELVNESGLITFHDLDSPEANDQIDIRISDQNSLFRKECSVLANPEVNVSSTIIICGKFGAGFL